MFINGILTGLILGAAIMFYWRLLMRVKRKERFQMVRPHRPPSHSCISTLYTCVQQVD